MLFFQVRKFQVTLPNISCPRRNFFVNQITPNSGFHPVEKDQFHMNSNPYITLPIKHQNIRHSLFNSALSPYLREKKIRVDGLRPGPRKSVAGRRACILVLLGVWNFSLLYLIYIAISRLSF